MTPLAFVALLSRRGIRFRTDVAPPRFRGDVARPLVSLEVDDLGLWAAFSVTTAWGAARATAELRIAAGTWPPNWFHG